jgi:general stress protein 26
MRLTERAILRKSSSESKQRIAAFVRAHSSGVLSLVDADNNPHATAIYYSVDRSLNFYFTTKQDTQKQDILARNNHAQLLIYAPYSQTTVQVTGEVTEITGTPLAETVFEATEMAAYWTSEAGVAPIDKLYAGDYVAYRLQPRQIRMAMFMRPGSGGYDMFETVDF